MKKHETPTRTLLGITQEDMAMLLGISRGQWSMYESGNRPLPSHAIPIFTQLMLHAQQQHEAKLSGKTQRPGYEKEVLQALELMLEDAQYRHRAAANKLAALQKKQDVQHKRVQTTLLLSQMQHTGKGSHPNEMAQGLTAKLPATWDQDMVVNVMRQELQLEFLEMEQAILKKKITEITTNSKSNDYKK